MKKDKNTGRDNGLPTSLGRRQFITSVATAAAGGMVLPGCVRSQSPTAGLPDPSSSGIDHIIVVMMENRSFDHYLGWVPGANGVQAGTTQKDSTGQAYMSRDLAPMYQNCNLADPDHSYAGGHTQVNGGKMDGFLLTQPVGDDFPIGYYTADSLPFFKGCADNWTICDNYFCSILGPTTPNRIYMHAGQTDRITNSVTVSTLPTIWDSMLGAGRSVKYYYTDVPYTSFWGSKYQSFSTKYDMASFAADMASGNLADLTFVDNVGNTANEGLGISQDDHPYADIRNGQAFLNAVYDAIRTNPKWANTLVVINYDEWGGFYDHVPPPFAPITAAEATLGNDGRLGCRVPCVLIGPRARRNHVEHLQFDHNSVLNMISWRFGTEPLGVRGSSNNIALALDFSSPPNYDTPTFSVSAGLAGGLCLPTGELISFTGLPINVPGIPVPITSPAGLPPVPGLDVPFPSTPTASAGEIESFESLHRRAAHDHELDGLRALSKKFGFA